MTPTHQARVAICVAHTVYTARRHRIADATLVAALSVRTTWRGRRRTGLFGVADFGGRAVDVGHALDAVTPAPIAHQARTLAAARTWRDRFAPVRAAQPRQVPDNPSRGRSRRRLPRSARRLVLRRYKPGRSRIAPRRRTHSRTATRQSPKSPSPSCQGLRGAPLDLPLPAHFYWRTRRRSLASQDDVPAGADLCGATARVDRAHVLVAKRVGRPRDRWEHERRRDAGDARVDVEASDLAAVNHHPHVLAVAGQPVVPDRDRHAGSIYIRERGRARSFNVVSEHPEDPVEG